jgi:exonuclease VII small subunit
MMIGGPGSIWIPGRLPRDATVSRKGVFPERGENLLERGENLLERGENLLERGESLLERGENLLERGENLLERGENLLGRGAEASKTGKISCLWFFCPVFSELP